MNSKPTKIIHLSFFNSKKPKTHPTVENGYYYIASWAGQIARRLKNRFPDMDIEVWRAEPEFDEVSFRKVFDVNAYIFPYKKPIVKRTFTYLMWKRLINLRKDHNIILNYHSLFDSFTFFSLIFLKNIDLVFFHHGGLPPGKRFSLKYSLKRILIQHYYPKAGFVTYLNDITKKYLESFMPNNKIGFLPVGADFDEMKPLQKSKARDLLKLDQNKVYAIYVGKLYRLKGVDHILNAYEKLKNKYNFSVLFVGPKFEGEPDIYNKVMKSGCKYFGAVPWTEMKYYYSAADFFIHPVFDPKVGFDVSLLEAMAANLPVVSARLNSIERDIDNLGYQVNTINEFYEKTELMIINYKDFTNVRDVAIQYFDSNDAIPSKINSIYNHL